MSFKGKGGAPPFRTPNSGWWWGFRPLRRIGFGGVGGGGGGGYFIVLFIYI